MLRALVDACKSEVTSEPNDVLRKIKIRRALVNACKLKVKSESDDVSGKFNLLRTVVDSNDLEIESDSESDDVSGKSNTLRTVVDSNDLEVESDSEDDEQKSHQEPYELDIVNILLFIFKKHPNSRLAHAITKLVVSAIQNDETTFKHFIKIENNKYLKSSNNDDDDDDVSNEDKNKLILLCKVFNYLVHLKRTNLIEIFCKSDLVKNYPSLKKHFFAKIAGAFATSNTASLTMFLRAQILYDNILENIALAIQYSADTTLLTSLINYAAENLPIGALNNDVTINISSKTSKKITLLTLAAAKGNLTAVNALLTRGVDINHYCSGSETPLIAACQNANTEVALSLVYEEKINVSIECDNHTALEAAFVQCSPDRVIESGLVQELIQALLSREKKAKIISWGDTKIDDPLYHLNKYILLAFEKKWHSILQDCLRLDLFRMSPEGYLITAIQHGADRDLINELISLYINTKLKRDKVTVLFSKEQANQSPLQIAIQLGDKLTIVTLLSSDNAIILELIDGFYPIEVAIAALTKNENYSLDIICELLEHSKLLCADPSKNAMTHYEAVTNMIRVAFTKKHEKLLQILFNSSVLTSREYNYFTLMYAILHSAPRKLITVLISTLATSPDGMKEFNSALQMPILFGLQFGSLTAMCLAVYLNDWDTINTLIQFKVPINVVIEGVYPPLLHVISNCDAKKVELFLKNGADPNTVHNDVSALILAIRLEKIAVVQQLFKYHADPNLMPSTFAPLHAAAEVGNIDILAELFYQRAEINVCTKDNMCHTPLSIAIARNKIAAALWLIDHKANIHSVCNPAPSSPNMPLLLFAVKQRLYLVVEALIRVGANPNLFYKHAGILPITTAILNGNISMVDGLLKLGADFSNEIPHHQICLNQAENQIELFTHRENFNRNFPPNNSMSNDDIEVLLMAIAEDRQFKMVQLLNNEILFNEFRSAITAHFNDKTLNPKIFFKKLFNLQSSLTILLRNYPKRFLEFYKQYFSLDRKLDCSTEIWKIFFQAFIELCSKPIEQICFLINPIQDLLLEIISSLFAQHNPLVIGLIKIAEDLGCHENQHFYACIFNSNLLIEACTYSSTQQTPKDWFTNFLASNHLEQKLINAKVSFAEYALKNPNWTREIFLQTTLQSFIKDIQIAPPSANSAQVKLLKLYICKCFIHEKFSGIMPNTEIRKKPITLSILQKELDQFIQRLFSDKNERPHRAKFQYECSKILTELYDYHFGSVTSLNPAGFFNSRQFKTTDILIPSPVPKHNLRKTSF